MAKRKAESPKDVTNKRSSRRKTPGGDELADSKRPITSSRARKDRKTPKASESGMETVKKEDLNMSRVLASSQLTGSEFPNGNTPTTQRYWLMKAEPQSRLERGHDIKFSIDDLATKMEPEPWDGIRAYPARNNLRAMKKGDLAFFYHSNCKVPAIAGIMEVVKEHSPDLSAQDPNAPYYDPKDDDVSNPKWSVVHVEFRRKLKSPITLKELREFSGKGGPLEGMQMLKQSRLSVSVVAKEEWDFIMGVIEERESEKD